MKLVVEIQHAGFRYIAEILVSPGVHEQQRSSYHRALSLGQLVVRGGQAATSTLYRLCGFAPFAVNVNTIGNERLVVNLLSKSARSVLLDTSQ